ncbi:MAG TPA: CapA family protein [Steroidobacter sp.]|uniref:CapA family protein n=1 Tax=Steroidobacter sp. TaxID=1978227 RepID=UPI002EDA2294
MSIQAAAANTLTLFMCGDVMTGRGIDQILPHPSAPEIYEPYVSSAYEYVELAERANGRIDKPQSFSYIWGDILPELERHRPAIRIANLETAVTTSDEAWPGKGIHYRMHPRNVDCLTAAALDCCVLANNHTLDWSREGLAETLRVLREAGIKTAGAGDRLADACEPARFKLSDRQRLLVFACGSPDSGIGVGWEATEYRSGLWVIDDLNACAIEQIGRRIESERRRGDIVVMSLHWGGNWGYEVTREQQRFAHQLIDKAGIDIVHGHSSHHPRPIEVYRGKLILYGCGDLLNDYEGIGGYERYRSELGLMYFPEIDRETHQLVRLTMSPTCIRRLRVNLAQRNDAQWLAATLSRECAPFGTSLRLQPDGDLALKWQHDVEAIA